MLNSTTMGKNFPVAVTATVNVAPPIRLKHNTAPQHTITHIIIATKYRITFAFILIPPYYHPPMEARNLYLHFRLKIYLYYTIFMSILQTCLTQLCKYCIISLIKSMSFPAFGEVLYERTINIVSLSCLCNLLRTFYNLRSNYYKHIYTRQEDCAWNCNLIISNCNSYLNAYNMVIIHNRYSCILHKKYYCILYKKSFEKIMLLLIAYTF